MPPYRMGLFYKGQTVILTSAQVPGTVVMKHLMAFQKDHRVARVSTRERLANDYIAGTCLAGRHLAEAIGGHVLDIKVLAAQPPAIASLKVRQINAAQVIGIPEQRVTVHGAMLEPTAQQMRNRPELSQRAAAGQPPR